MTGVIVGSELRKLSVEKQVLKRPLKISNDIKIIGVDRKELTSGRDKKDGLVFHYLFRANYEDSGSIEVEGSLFYIDEKEELEEIKKQYEKNQRIKEDLILPVLNRALELSYIQAINLSSSVRLPPPIELPRFISGPKEESKEEKAKAK
jgi:hypothetical protein